jgi:hypothetical protein
MAAESGGQPKLQSDRLRKERKMTAGPDESGGSGGPNTPKDLPQHPLVERLKPDPSQPPLKTIDLVGLPGRSDRAGFQRLYLTTKLDYFAEFQTSDLLHAEAVPADQSPLSGQEATRVSVARNATIYYTSARSAQPVDEFDLDIRLGAPSAVPAAHALPAKLISPANGCTDACPTNITCPHTACPQTACHTVCGTCNTCVTCQGMATCAAAATCAGHGTCVNTQCVQQTCVFTQNNAGTCVTCVFTACNQGTCANTQCQQATCLTCPADNTCAATCVA